MKGFGNIMKEAQKLQAQMEQLQAEAAKKTVEATAGGGMVTVVANGKQEVVSIKIDREVINPEDAQMLEDLRERAHGSRRLDSEANEDGARSTIDALQGRRWIQRVSPSQAASL